jgi:Mn-dependent DtxR family transcriptional regulator
MELRYPEPGTLDYRILSYFLFNNQPIKPGTLAKELEIPHQTLNSALFRLSEHGLIKWEKYKDVQLTQGGLENLKHLEYHFHLVEIFLMNSLGLSSEEAIREASRLAPYFSCNLITAIYKKADNPSSCPNHVEPLHDPNCFVK